MIIYNFIANLGLAQPGKRMGACVEKLGKEITCRQLRAKIDSNEHKSTNCNYPLRSKIEGFLVTQENPVNFYGR